MDAADRVARARGIRCAPDALDVYRAWAQDYDEDVFGALGFTGTDRIADLMAEYVPAREGSEIVDLGCGTGAAGERLRHHGFEVIDGVDISAEMLAVAARKRVYRALIAADLNDELSLPVAGYDAAVSAGTFTSGHVGVAAVPAILRILRPGGVLAWVIATPLWAEFERAVAGVDILHAVEEPIRRGGPPEAVMFVAATSRSSPGERGPTDTLDA